jgi:hypothetical protein
MLRIGMVLEIWGLYALSYWRMYGSTLWRVGDRWHAQGISWCNMQMALSKTVSTPQ